MNSYYFFYIAKKPDDSYVLACTQKHLIFLIDIILSIFFLILFTFNGRNYNIEVFV